VTGWAGMEPLLRAKDVAKILDLSTRSATRLMATGAIESCRVGTGLRLIRTTASRVERYQAARFAIGTAPVPQA
jgi:prophage antirepressor-like protein